MSVPTLISKPVLPQHANHYEKAAANYCDCKGKERSATMGMTRTAVEIGIKAGALWITDKIEKKTDNTFISVASGLALKKTTDYYAKQLHIGQLINEEVEELEGKIKEIEKEEENASIFSSLFSSSKKSQLIARLKHLT